MRVRAVVPARAARRTPMTDARPCETLERAVDAAAEAHARIQYRHASSLNELTEQDRTAMRAFVTPLVKAALDAVTEEDR
jgi:hypothetical protein